jgi:hypothetical protein
MVLPVFHQIRISGFEFPVRFRMAKLAEDVFEDGVLELAPGGHFPQISGAAWTSTDARILEAGHGRSYVVWRIELNWMSP